LVAFGKQVTAPLVRGNVGVVVNDFGVQVPGQSVGGRFAECGLEVAKILG
jgi:hypothetical protein